MGIHGKASFTDDEWNGFLDAISESKETNLVGVTIKENNGFKILKNIDDPKSQYGVLRGLALMVDNKSGYLWTKGFIPKTETSNHLEVAVPLYLRGHPAV